MPEVFEVRATCTLSTGWVIRIWRGWPGVPTESDILSVQRELTVALFDLCCKDYGCGELAAKLIEVCEYDAVEVTKPNGMGAVIYRNWP